MIPLFIKNISLLVTDSLTHVRGSVRGLSSFTLIGWLRSSSSCLLLEGVKVWFV